MTNKLKFIFFFFSVALFISCANEIKDQRITFNSNVAAIIFKNCTPCHRKGASGPFPLTTYEEVRKHAKMIVKVTKTGFMPPWPADHHYRSFEGQKVLSQKEIEILKLWQVSGCLEGDNSNKIKAPNFPEGSLIGKPDLVLKLDKAYHLEGDNTDKFLLMKFPYQLDQDTFIRCIEFVADNRQLVHHANVHMISYKNDSKKNVFTGERVLPSWGFDRKTAFEKMGIPNDDGTYPLLTTSVSNYLPGMEPYYFPDQLGGYYMSKTGAFLINDIHYGPSSKDTYDNSYLNVFFMPRPPKRPVKELILGTLGVSQIIPPLIIEPNTIKKFETRYTVTKDISLINVNPHMHLIGKKIIAYALSPDFDTLPIIRINKWDFRWQYVYTFQKLLKIPAGYTIVAQGIFDNTINNPENPFNPPQMISEKNGSMRTIDEMFQLIMQYVPYQVGDEQIDLTSLKIKN